MLSLGSSALGLSARGRGGELEMQLHAQLLSKRMASVDLDRDLRAPGSAGSPATAPCTPHGPGQAGAGSLGRGGLSTWQPFRIDIDVPPACTCAVPSHDRDSIALQQQQLGGGVYPLSPLGRRAGPAVANAGAGPPGSNSESPGYRSGGPAPRQPPLHGVLSPQQLQREQQQQQARGGGGIPLTPRARAGAAAHEQLELRELFGPRAPNLNPKRFGGDRPGKHGSY